MASSGPVFDEIDFTQMLKDYAEMRQAELNSTQNRGNFIIKAPEARDVSFVLKNVHLAVPEEECIWEEAKETTPPQSMSRQVQVKSSAANVFGQVQAEQNMDMETTIKITHGGCIGIEKSFELPLPKEPEALRKALGSILLVNPSDGKTEIKKAMKVAVLSGQENVESNSTAIANITCNEQAYQGRFECKVYPTGNVLLTTVRDNKESKLPSEINTMITALKRENKSSVKHFNASTVAGEWYWIMKGYGTMKWEFGNTIEWT